MEENSHSDYDFELDFEDELAEFTRACSWGGLLDGLSKNAFILMGKTTNAAATIKDFNYDNIDALHAACLELGEDVGTFLRISLGFEP